MSSKPIKKFRVLKEEYYSGNTTYRVQCKRKGFLSEWEDYSHQFFWTLEECNSQLDKAIETEKHCRKPKKSVVKEIRV